MSDPSFRPRSIARSNCNSISSDPYTVVFADDKFDRRYHVRYSMTRLRLESAVTCYVLTSVRCVRTIADWSLGTCLLRTRLVAGRTGLSHSHDSDSQARAEATTYSEATTLAFPERNRYAPHSLCDLRHSLAVTQVEGAWTRLTVTQSRCCVLGCCWLFTASRPHGVAAHAYAGCTPLAPSRVTEQRSCAAPLSAGPARASCASPEAAHGRPVASIVSRILV